MGMGLSRAGSNCFESSGGLSMKSIRFQPGSNMEKMGMGRSRAGSNCFGSRGRLSINSIRFQRGSNIFVAAMEVQN